MNRRYARRHRKGFWQKLLSSPGDQGVMGSPFIFFLVGAGFAGFAIDGLFTGELDIGRYGTENIIQYSDGAGFFIFCAVSMLVLGIIALFWGRRLWRQHDEH